MIHKHLLVMSARSAQMSLLWDMAWILNTSTGPCHMLGSFIPSAMKAVQNEVQQSSQLSSWIA